MRVAPSRAVPLTVGGVPFTGSGIGTTEVCGERAVSDGVVPSKATTTIWSREPMSASPTT